LNAHSLLTSLFNLSVFIRQALWIVTLAFALFLEHRAASLILVFVETRLKLENWFEN
jgi:hypothetical protein